MPSQMIPSHQRNRSPDGKRPAPRARWNWIVTTCRVQRHISSVYGKRAARSLEFIPGGYGRSASHLHGIGLDRYIRRISRALSNGLNYSALG